MTDNTKPKSKVPIIVAMGALGCIAFVAFTLSDGDTKIFSFRRELDDKVEGFTQMANTFLISFCAAFLTPMVHYGFRWWKRYKGWKNFLRHMGYALFVGFMNYLTLFIITELYDVHFLLQIIYSFLGSLFMLKADWYFHFIKGIPTPTSNTIFVGRFWQDPESVLVETQDTQK